LTAVRVNDTPVIADAIDQLAAVGIYNAAIVTDAVCQLTAVRVDDSSVSDSKHKLSRVGVNHTLTVVVFFIHGSSVLRYTDIRPGSASNLACAVSCQHRVSRPTATP
jgi:hypothetical protein